MHKIRVAFLTAGDPRINASARFRVYQFLPYLEKDPKIHVVGTAVLNSYLSLAEMVVGVGRLLYMAVVSDVMFVQKARLPIPVFWLLSRLTRVIYDFDDSTFLPPPSWEDGKAFKSRRSRLDYTLKHSARVIVGNDYLAAYASRFNQVVDVVPTVVTTEPRLPDDAYGWGVPPQIYTLCSGKVDDRPIVVGWIGGGEHVKQLNRVLPALQNLQQEYDIEIKVVSDRQWMPEGLSVDNKEWRLEDEVVDVQSFDIGLMPLDASDPFLKGKCAFKAIEYMAVGVPAVATAVGANNEAIAHGETGFLVKCEDEWQAYLRMLIEDDELRKRLGKNARVWTAQNYSLESVLPTYIELLLATAGYESSADRL